MSCRQPLSEIYSCNALLRLERCSTRVSGRWVRAVPSPLLNRVVSLAVRDGSARVDRKAMIDTQQPELARVDAWFVSRTGRSHYFALADGAWQYTCPDRAPRRVSHGDTVRIVVLVACGRALRAAYTFEDGRRTLPWDTEGWRERKPPPDSKVRRRPRICQRCGQPKIGRHPICVTFDDMW